MLLVWFACTHPPSPTPSESASPEIPAIDQALSERCPDPTPRRRVMPPGDTLHRVTLDTAARCNDGSPPVIYVRPASDPAHLGDWVLHLESGGLCSDAESCAVRWCAEDPYDAANMSSRWSPETAAGQGIASAEPGNTFAGWNQVELHYCSSDFWTGRAGDVEMAGDSPYRIHFEGHTILGAALDALIAGVVSDDAVAALPPLLPAGTVVFGGSSAGGYGAMTELGRVAAALPGVRVIGTPDAAFSPAPETLTPALATAVADELERQWTTYLGPLWDAYIDGDCAATVPADEPWKCIDVDRLLRQPRTTEIVYHHDLTDPVLFSFFEPIGFDIPTYAAAGEGSLRLYGGLDGVSVHGSRCKDHTALDSNDAFFRQAVADALTGPPAFTLHDEVTAALTGQRVVAVDNVFGIGSDCP